MEEQTTMDPASAADPAEPVPQLTGIAVEMVHAGLRREGLVDHALRVAVVGGGCSGFQYSLRFDNIFHPEDTVVEQQGVRIVVDATSAQHLHGTTIDYVQGLHGAGFKFLNPKAVRTCGCGSSFSA
jgi:iron-sulfur cluster assembly accessory protein